jgi:hypothetical protein
MRWLISAGKSKLKASQMEHQDVELAEVQQPSRTTLEFNRFVSRKYGELSVSWSPKSLPLIALSCPTPTLANSRTSHIMDLTLKTVESNVFAGIAAFLTVLVLACEDINVVADAGAWNMLLEWLLACSIVVFGFELLVLCVLKEEYCWSAWFPLDVLAFMTLAMDLPWFQAVAFSEENSVFSPSQENAVRTGGQAAHALRVARVLRILRLARFIKLYKLVLGLISCFEGRSVACRMFKYLMNVKAPRKQTCDSKGWVTVASEA